MHHEESFRWLGLLPGVSHWPNHIAMTILVGGVLLVFGAVAAAQLRVAMGKPDGALVPESKLSFRNFFDLLAEMLYGMTENVLGKDDAKKYFPFIGSLFVFIFFSNLIGMVPGFLPSTENLNTTIALGIVAFAYYNYQGFKEHGLSYLKHFLGPLWWLAPLMLIIELASHIFRPLSLALRLRGNIMGDHVVHGVFAGLLPYLIPVVFLGLGVFVSFIQAFVFVLMTMVYINLSTSHDH